MDKNEFAVWIENEYLKWQLRQKGRKSIAEFSDWLGFPKTTVVQWMNGQRKPGAETADKISIKLNYDLTVYELLGLPVPEKRLLEFKAMYPSMTDEDIADLDKFLEKIKKRHAAEKKHDVSKSGNVDQNGTLAHAGRTS